jgi:hypothetical protein
MLQEVDPVDGREGGRQVKEEGELDARDAEQEEVGEAAPGYSQS